MAKAKHRKRGAVAAGHRQTAESAANILMDGGNAFDAGLAALLTSMVTEPCMSSPGGGAFAVYSTAERQFGLIDFFCQTPSQKKDVDELHFYPYTVKFGDSSEVFHAGLGSMAVPGIPAGIEAIHKELCTIPLTRLAEQAVNLGFKGAEVDPFQQLDFDLLEGILLSTGEGKAMYTRADGKLYRSGDIMKLPQLADFLDYFSRNGSKEFYLGEPALKTAEACANDGGHLTRQDFEQYRIQFPEPLSFNAGNYRFHTVPAPSMGGEILRKLILTDDWYNAPHSMQPEAYAKIFTYAEQNVDKGAGLRHQLSNALPNKRGNTSHISVADAAGNAMAITMTNGEGSGFVIPGTQIMMNNMLGEAILMPAGFHSWPENVRLASMMSPVIAQHPESGEIIIAGTGGAGRIPYMLAQFFRYLLQDNYSLQKAIESPRLHFQYNGFDTEPGLKLPETEPFDRYSHTPWSMKNLYFGGINAVKLTGHQLEAHADSRRWGVAFEV